MIRSITLLWLSFFVTGLSAQQWCASHSARHDPAVKEAPPRMKTVITIPVLVHILWSSPEEDIADEQVFAQIEVLNRDFRALNTDLSNVIFYYQDRVADMDINFELVNMDPEGNSHTGIIRKEVPPGIWNDFSNGRRHICYDELGGSSAWCTSCYLNIWVGRMSSPEIAGMGIFPTQLGNDVPREEDGIYVRYDRFGPTATTLGRTATHEMGHYLNLLHPWGGSIPDDDCNPTSCCGEPAYDDFVADTEDQIQTYLNECPSGSQQSCDLPDNYQNFMGFSNDNCLLMFTEGQKTRAWEALMNYRTGLLDANCCANLCITSIDETVAIDQWLGAIWVNGTSLHMDVKISDLNWQLFDMQGRQIHFWPTTIIGLHREHLPNLSPGIYLLKAQKDKQFSIKKILILQN